jgi:hypothetical protein
VATHNPAEEETDTLGNLEEEDQTVMDIKMPIRFQATYQIIVRSAGAERKERCQKLDVRQLSEQEKGNSHEGMDQDKIPTHQLTFYDFGCKRIIDGRLKDNEAERVVFQVEDKEYELSPFRPARRE